MKSFLMLWLLSMPDQLSAQKSVFSTPLQTSDLRSHRAWLTPDGSVAYTVTRIQQLSEPRDAVIYLIEDEYGDQFIASFESAYERHEFRYEIRHVETDTYVTYILPILAKARSRTELVREMRAAPLSDPDDDVFTIEAGGLTRTAKAADWKKFGNATAWRRELRRAGGPRIVEAVEAFRSGLLAAELEGFCESLVKQLVYGEQDCSRASPLRKQPLPADCDFDKNFGYPCTEQQKKRIATRQRELKPTHTY